MDVVAYYVIDIMFKENHTLSWTIADVLVLLGAEAANSSPLGCNTHRAKHMRKLAEASIWNQRHRSLAPRHGRGGDP
jgi:hypothetical protein